MARKRIKSNAGAKKSGGYGWLFFVLIAALVYVFQQEEQVSVPDESPLTRVAPPATLYALSAADYSWPTPTKVALSSDLLARNYYLVFDGSGSMAERDCGDGQTKLEVAKKAFLAFLRQLPADANVGLYVFDEHRMAEAVALGLNNRSELEKAVMKVQAGGGTPLSSAVATGFASLTTQAQAQLGYGEYHLVVITDGMASEGYDPTDKVRLVLESSPVNVHTIGFCLDEYHVLNQRGLTYYRAASDAEGLMAGLSDVLAEAPDFTVLEFER